MAIHFHNEYIGFPDINKKSTKSWVKQVIKVHAKQLGDINYIFTNDENILSINTEHLKHDYYTDVITFDYTQENKISGDIYISLDTVKSNSEKFNQEYLNELMRVVIHGVLHLIGLKDKTESEAKEMRIEEEKALSILYKTTF